MKRKHGYMDKYKDINLVYDNDYKLSLSIFNQLDLKTKLQILRNLCGRNKKFIEYIISNTDYTLCDEIYNYHLNNLENIKNKVWNPFLIMDEYRKLTKQIGIPDVPENYITNPDAFNTGKLYTQNNKNNRFFVLSGYVIQHYYGVIFKVYLAPNKIDSSNHPFIHNKKHLFYQDMLEQYITEMSIAFWLLSIGDIDGAFNKFCQVRKCIYGTVSKFFIGEHYHFYDKRNKKHEDRKKIKNHYDERMYKLLKQYRDKLTNYFEIEFEKASGKTLKQYERYENEIKKKMKALKRELGDLF